MTLCILLSFTTQKTTSGLYAMVFMIFIYLWTFAFSLMELNPAVVQDVTSNMATYLH